MPRRKTHPDQEAREVAASGAFEDPEEPDSPDTLAALRNGDPVPLRAYLRDLGGNLALLADLLNPKDGKEPEWDLRDRSDRGSPDQSAESDDPTPLEAEVEWLSSTSQAREAIETGSRHLI